MTEEEAWEKIINLTNKEDLSQKDREAILELSEFLPRDKRSWIDEGLFLSDVNQAPSAQKKISHGKDD